MGIIVTFTSPRSSIADLALYVLCSSCSNSTKLEPLEIRLCMCIAAPWHVRSHIRLTALMGWDQRHCCALCLHGKAFSRNLHAVTLKEFWNILQEEITQLQGDNWNNSWLEFCCWGKPRINRMLRFYEFNLHNEVQQRWQHAQSRVYVIFLSYVWPETTITSF